MGQQAQMKVIGRQKKKIRMQNADFILKVHVPADTMIKLIMLTSVK